MKSVFKKITIFFLLVSLILPAVIVAQEESPAPTPEAINSFELFWPMVAGKTRADGLVYKVKRFKEEFRGMLIFGKSQKASYQVFLGTKRVLEAEKLLNENQNDLAVVTLETAQRNFEKAKAAGATVDAQALARLQNLEKLLTWLGEDQGEDIIAELESVKSELAKLL